MNVSKTKVIVFEPKHIACPDFIFDGQLVERVTMFKYLGITFHATRGLSFAIEHLCNSANKALFAMYGRCHELQITSPSLKCRLFDALVRPILSYASEILVILGGKVALQSLERVHVQFLRQLLGVPISTSTKFILAEFGRLPLKHSWLQNSLKYLSRLQKMDEGRLCKLAFSADMQNGKGWFYKLKDELREGHGIGISARALADFDLVTSSRALKDSFILQGMTAEANNHLQSTYFSLKTEFRCEPYIDQSKNKHVRSTLARFRVGCHWLQVCMGRRCRVEYEQRQCPMCRESCVEDELHAIFDCGSYVFQRNSFDDLFENGCSLRSFLASNPPHRVVAFLDGCRATRVDGPNVDIVDVTTDVYNSP